MNRTEQIRERQLTVKEVIEQRQKMAEQAQPFEHMLPSDAEEVLEHPYSQLMRKLEEQKSSPNGIILTEDDVLVLRSLLLSSLSKEFRHTAIAAALSL